MMMNRSSSTIQRILAFVLSLSLCGCAVSASAENPGNIPESIPQDTSVLVFPAAAGEAVRPEDSKAEETGTKSFERILSDNPSGAGPQAYIIHVVDQHDDPVPEAAVIFCTDTSCTPQETDETGTISFAGEPYPYHLQIIDVPDGYSYDEDLELYTTLEYGEWILHVIREE